MLIINKNSYLNKIIINYKNMFFIKDSIRFKKSISHTIFLRAPKHFNIGKIKVKNINYKYFKILCASNLNISSKFFFYNNLLFFYINKNANTNILKNVNSYQVFMNTKLQFLL